MNLKTGILMVVFAACAAYAQAPANASAAKKAAPAPRSVAAKPQSAPGTAAAQPKKAHSAKKAAATKAPAGKQSEAKAEAVNTASAVNAPAPSGGRRTAGKRDPFISPVSDRNNEPIDCGTGKRCLVPDQTMLRGVVKAPGGMIAVVTNPQEKAYFLRENDPVYNGYVLRITPNTVVFRETVEDRLGRKSTREVVKKVNAPVV